MKILLINNHTRHLPSLAASLTGHDLEVREYLPGMDFSCSDKDLIVLSGGGGEGLEIHDEHKPGKLWYQDEINFVRLTNKPVLGICMGFEVIARAYGAPVMKMPNGVEGFVQFAPTNQGKESFKKRSLRQFESHDWHVPKIPSGFRALAKSNTGVEIIQHKTKPILATQFHPEKGGTLSMSDLIGLGSKT